MFPIWGLFSETEAALAETEDRNFLISKFYKQLNKNPTDEQKIGGVPPMTIISLL